MPRQRNHDNLSFQHVSQKLMCSSIIGVKPRGGYIDIFVIQVAIGSASYLKLWTIVGCNNSILPIVIIRKNVKIVYCSVNS